MKIFSKKYIKNLSFVIVVSMLLTIAVNTVGSYSVKADFDDNESVNQQTDYTDTEDAKDADVDTNQNDVGFSMATLTDAGTEIFDATSLDANTYAAGETVYNGAYFDLVAAWGGAEVVESKGIKNSGGGNLIVTDGTASGRGVVVFTATTNGAVTVTWPTLGSGKSGFIAVATEDSTALSSVGLVAGYTISKMEKVTNGNSNSAEVQLTRDITSGQTYMIGGCGTDGYISTIEFTSNSIVDSGTCGDNLIWIFDESGTLTISGTGDMDNYTSTTSAPWSNYQSSIKKVEMLNGITSIGVAAFYQCTSLSNVTIPDGVTSIGSSAFNNCSALNSIAIPASITYFAPAAFNNCINLENVYITDLSSWLSISLGSSIKAGADGASPLYYAENLYINDVLATDIVIPDNINNIGDYAFYGCTCLESVTMSDNITSIGEQAFRGCTNLSDLTIGNGVVSIGFLAFYGCTSLENVLIPNSVKEIEDRVFSDCSSLTNVTFSNNLENVEIGYGAFWDCYALENVYVSSLESWLSITFEAATANPMNFANNLYVDGEPLTELIIPDDIETIGEYAFFNCDCITSVLIPNSVVEIGDNAFMYCNNLENVTMLDGITKIGSTAFASCTGLISVTMPESLLTIGGNAFSGCVSLTNVTIPNGVTTIGSGAFSYCTGLTNIEIPDSVAVLGGGAFAYCSNLKNVTILCDFGLYWGGSNFIDCTNLTHVTFGNNVTNIAGGTMFDGCTKLESVTIPNSVINISDSTFSDCSALTDVYYSGSESEWSTITIGDNNDYLLNATIHYNSNEMITLTSVNSTISVPVRGETVSYKAVAPIDANYTFSDVSWSPEVSNKYAALTVYTAMVTATANNGYVFSDDTVAYINGNEATSIEVSSDKKTVTFTYKFPQTSSYDTIPTATPTVSPSPSPTAKPTATPTASPSPTPTATPSSESDNIFTMFRDNYSFPNTYSSFGYGFTYKIPLERYITVLGVTKGTQKFKDSGYWGGSCYGFSASSALFFNGDLDYTDYDSKANNLYSISAPRSTTADLTILIEEYQLSQSIYEVSHETYCNYDKMSDIISAVKHFEETGEDPIILCMWEVGGHAVLPYKVVTNSDGSYSVFVYDNNYPQDNNRIVTINKNMTEFSYDDYTSLISYVYVESVYKAFAADTASMASVDDVATIVVNSNDINFTDANGVSIENIDGAYEVIPVLENYNGNRREFVVPVGDYIITNNNTDIEQLEVSIANEKDYLNISSEDLSATVMLGVNSTTGRAYVYVESESESKNSIQSLTSTGSASYLETTGSVLGAEVNSSNSIKITSDSNVNFDGDLIIMGIESGVEDMNVMLDTDVGDDSGDKNCTIALSNSTLTQENSTISGNLAFNVYNNTGSVQGARFMTCLYTSDGILESVIKNDDIILGIGSNYIGLGDIDLTNLSSDKYYVKSFIWDDLGTMQPLGETYTLNID